MSYCLTRGRRRGAFSSPTTFDVAFLLQIIAEGILGPTGRSYVSPGRSPGIGGIYRIEPQRGGPIFTLPSCSAAPSGLRGYYFFAIPVLRPGLT